jgi:general L-amino acid transport system permease protein
MTVYVEVFRNVPLLLWIILSLWSCPKPDPQPKDFKVTDEMIAAGEAAQGLDDARTPWPSPTAAPTFPKPLLDRGLGRIDIGGCRSTSPSSPCLAVIVRRIALCQPPHPRAAKATQEATGIRP